jgi:hypothetical protein
MRPETIDRVFVSWTRHWELDEYVEHYLRARRLSSGDDMRRKVLECMTAYTGRAPYTKSDLDLFLDANIGRTAGRNALA